MQEYLYMTINETFLTALYGSALTFLMLLVAIMFIKNTFNR